MDFDLDSQSPRASRDSRATRDNPGSAAFEISSKPHIAGQGSVAPEVAGLPRTYGTQTLCLMARDPHTLFAYWDIDWEEAFQSGKPSDRKVHLRIADPAGNDQTIEVEPMAGSCYLTVDDADSVYTGEIGFFRPARQWNQLAASEWISTPPESLSELAETDLATVPFHLSFQRMIDTLRGTPPEGATLTEKLSELRERSATPETASAMTTAERELMRAVEAVETMPPARPNDSSILHRQKRIERILGLGGSSPSGGFGGSSRSA